MSRAPRLLVLAVALLSARAARAQLKVVNMVPAAASSESQQDSSPDLTVDPARHDLIVASALTATPAGSPHAPLYVSTDGGNTFSLHAILPSQPGARPGTHEVTVRFNGAGTALYAGMLRADPGLPDDFELDVLRTTDLTFITPMAILASRRGPEQPFLQAVTVAGWFDPGKDRLFLGLHQNAVAFQDQSLDAGAAAPVFSTVELEQNSPRPVDGFQTRPAVHPDGTIYSAFYRRTGPGTTSGSLTTYPAEIVVVRDDDWGRGASPFQALLDGANHRVGQRAVVNLLLPVNLQPEMGQDRHAGDLALAVDPVDHRVVYLGYLDKSGKDSVTLHVRSSSDAGQSWSGADLLLVHDARNIGLAVNSHGRLAVSYQQLAASGGGLRWQTHFRRLDGSAWDDTLLASTDAGSPVSVGWPYLGDRGCLLAAGRDFYGAFSASNRPDPTSFAPGTVWQRNVDLGRKRLLDVSRTTEVAPSIDPFFFRWAELPGDRDFFVRDFTDGARRDAGEEPSSFPDFIDASDVWNRREDDPGAFDAADRPVHEDPRPFEQGRDFAFVRVGRGAGGSTASVRVELFVADAGIGANFVRAGATAMAFANGDTVKSLAAGQGIRWNAPAGASSHVTLAAEISTASDPVIQPTLLGHAPGWPVPDLTVVEDNNKAQRSVQTCWGSAGSIATAYALVHNAAIEPRDVTLGVELPRGAQKVALRVIGGDGKKGGPGLVLPAMAPGENRWVELSFAIAAEKGGRTPPVRIYELWRGKRLSGVAIEGRTGSPALVARENVMEHAAVFTRIGAATQIAACGEQGAAASAALPEIEKGGAYGAFAKKQGAGMADCAQQLVQLAGGKDPFQLATAVKTLRASGEASKMAAAHTAVLARLDAFETMRQKAAGDAADAVQMMLWQNSLYRDRIALGSVRGGGALLAEGEAFVRASDQHKAGADDYVKLLKHSLNAYRATAAMLGTAGLEVSISAMERLSQPAPLERAHRDYLLKLAPGSEPPHTP